MVYGGVRMHCTSTPYKDVMNVVPLLEPPCIGSSAFNSVGQRRIFVSDLLLNVVNYSEAEQRDRRPSENPPRNGNKENKYASRHCCCVCKWCSASVSSAWCIIAFPSPIPTIAFNIRKNTRKKIVSIRSLMFGAQSRKLENEIIRKPEGNKERSQAADSRLTFRHTFFVQRFCFRFHFILNRTKNSSIALWCICGIYWQKNECALETTRRFSMTSWKTANFCCIYSYGLIDWVMFFYIYYSLPKFEFRKCRRQVNRSTWICTRKSNTKFMNIWLRYETPHAERYCIYELNKNEDNVGPVFNECISNSVRYSFRLNLFITEWH